MAASETGEQRPLTDRERSWVFAKFAPRLREWARNFRACSLPDEDREAEADAVTWEFSAKYDPDRDDTFFSLLTKPLRERLMAAPRQFEMAESARQRRYVRQALARLSPEQRSLPTEELCSLLMEKLHCDRHSAYAVASILQSRSLLGVLDDSAFRLGRAPETDRMIETRHTQQVFKRAHDSLCKNRRSCCRDCTPGVRVLCPFWVMMYYLGTEEWWDRGCVDEGWLGETREVVDAARDLGIELLVLEALLEKARRAIGRAEADESRM